MESFENFKKRINREINENYKAPDYEVDAAKANDFKKWPVNGPNPFEFGIETDPGDDTTGDEPWLSVYGPEKFHMFFTLKIDRNFHDTFPESAKKKIDDIEWELKRELDELNFKNMEKIQEIVRKHGKKIEEVQLPHYSNVKKYGLK